MFILKNISHVPKATASVIYLFPKGSRGPVINISFDVHNLKLLSPALPVKYDMSLTQNWPSVSKHTIAYC